MKQKTKVVILGCVAAFTMVFAAAPVLAAPSDHEMPARDDIFWTFFEQMNHPTDSTNCTAAVTNYVNGQTFENEQRRQEELQGMLYFCTGVSTMASEMEAEMAAQGIETSLFSNSNWHHVSGLYFQRSENGELMGRISFSQEIDFMSYEFFTFMNNFDNMIKLDNGYISLNASMIPEMINYGTTFTMYGLDFDEQPDIYVSNGVTMREAIEGTDLSGIVYDASAGTLTFTPQHFSSFRVVEKGSALKTMKITKVDPRQVKYRADKNTFRINVKGKNLFKRGSDTVCTLGFSQATKVHAGRAGKRVKCTFSMSDFSVLGYYPLVISIAGTGEVTKTNAVKIK